MGCVMYKSVYILKAEQSRCIKDRKLLLTTQKTYGEASKDSISALDYNFIIDTSNSTGTIALALQQVLPHVLSDIIYF